MSQNKQEKKKPFFKQPKFIFAITVAVIIAVLCSLFKYKVLIPVIILLVVFITIMTNRKILNQRKGRNLQEVSQHNLTDEELDKLTQHFVNRDEKYISSLGNGYIMNYLLSGDIRKGFAIISDKRVYFQGSCLSGQGKELHKTDESRVVNIKDVTGSGFIYRRYVGVLMGLCTALVILLGGILGSLWKLSQKWYAIKYYQEQAENLQRMGDEAQEDIKKIDENDERISVLDKQIAEIDAASAETDAAYNNAYEEYILELNGLFQKGSLYLGLNNVYNEISRYDSAAEKILKAVSLQNLPYYDNKEYVWDSESRCGYTLDNSLLYEAANGDVHCYSSSIDFCVSFVVQNVDFLNTLIWNPGNARERAIISSLESEPASQPTLEEIAYLEESIKEYFPYLDDKEAFQAAYDKFIENKNQIDKSRQELSDSRKQELQNELWALQNENRELKELRDRLGSISSSYDKAKAEAFTSFKETSFFAVVSGLLITFLISCSLVFADYLKKRKTMFQIQYAGGCIAFDVSLYAKAEIDDFQNQLRRVKDLAEESSSKISVTTVPMESSAFNSVPDDLRKYAELLKEGLISQEEYDVMKKKILNL